jgi:predicted Zn-dependent protease
MADSLMELGDYKNAIIAYNREEPTANLQFKIARAYTATGNVTQGIDFYKAGLALDSTAVKPRYELARLYLNTNDPINSLLLLNTLTAEFPENPSFKFYKAQGLELINSESQAIDVYENVLKLDPDYRNARIELVGLFIKKRETFPAIKYAQEALDKDPDDIKFNSLIAQAYFNARIYSKAIMHFERLFELKNDTEFNRRTLAVAYLEDAQWQKAIENFDIFLKQYDAKDAAVFFMKSKAHLKLREYDKAQDAIEYSILFKRPAIDVEYLQMAAIMAAREDYKGTFETMKLAYQENSEDAIIAYQLAVAADRYFKDKKTILVYYDRYLNKFGASSDYGEIVSSRASDLKKEIFMSPDN